ncbi:MAG: Tat pathway signal sequence domain protein [Alphaproteobacteria bacterium]|jgi:hypothetical protein|nr:Tat pathway signal sequence domain protein [Alphaproteobacteria bacterium]
MRRRLPLLAILALFAVSSLAAQAAYAQMGGGGGGSSDDEEKKKKLEEAFGGLNAPLPKVRNAGPCPFVKSLYDAARYVEFKGKTESFETVGFTGEIQNIDSDCAYAADQPIQVKAKIHFAFGRGPQADGRRHVYQYWVAVTDRNHAVLAKQEFTVPVEFPAGADRVDKTESVANIVIPRANARVSGSNFEVLVGFDVTPDMAAFNRAGKRFRPEAGAGDPGKS